MAHDRTTISELLHQHHIDPHTLEPAPTEPTDRELSTRIRHIHLQPCTACGEPGTTTRIHTSPQHGPRWIVLCLAHAIATMRPTPGIPDTMNELLADARRIAAGLGLRVPASVWTDKEGWRDELLQ